MRMLKELMYSAFLLLLTSLCNAEITTQIYSSQHISPDELSKILYEIYPDSKLSTQNKQLIIRAEKHIVSEIQELLPLLDKVSKQFILSFSTSPQHSHNKIYGLTENKLSNKTFILKDGETLTVDYNNEKRKLHSIALFYGSLETIEIEKNGLSITVQSITEQQLQITYRHYQILSSKRQAVESTLQVKLGEWISLNGQTGIDDYNTPTWSTNKQTGAQLYVRISES